MDLAQLHTDVLIIGGGASVREVSGGPHFRTDLPHRNDRQFAKLTAARKTDGEVEYRCLNPE